MDVESSGLPVLLCARVEELAAESGLLCVGSWSTGLVSFCHVTFADSDRPKAHQSAVSSFQYVSARPSAHHLPLRRAQMIGCRLH